MSNEPIVVSKLWVDEKPLPDHIPKVPEVGATSAPLESMAFHYGSFCKEYNEDFTLCKDTTTDPEACLKEGRRVTRCAIDFINRLEKDCGKEWKAHWKCLDMKNHMYRKCREEEAPFNDCVFKHFGLIKSIPGTPEGQDPVHLTKRPYLK